MMCGGSEKLKEPSCHTSKSHQANLTRSPELGRDSLLKNWILTDWWFTGSLSVLKPSDREAGQTSLCVFDL